MTRPVLLVLLALAAIVPAPARAQATAEDSVRAVVVGLFDAMRTRDSAAIRAAFDPSARLQTALERPDGTTLLRLDAVDTFVRAVGALDVHAGVVDRLLEPHPAADEAGQCLDDRGGDPAGPR